MGFLQDCWLLIKELFLSCFLKLFYVAPINNNVSKNSYSKHARNEATAASMTDDDKGQGSGADEEGLLPGGLRPELMPRHVAMTMDGNRRWAKQRGLSIEEGYEAGVTVMKEFVEMCVKWKIPVISMFTFSSENWRRPKEQVDFLVKLFEKCIQNDTSGVLGQGGRFSTIGDMTKFPKSLQEAVKHVEERTKDNTEFHLLFAMSYSGQDDIIQACQSISKKVKYGVLKLEDITSSMIEQELETSIADVPSPDLLIRTSGELRISNYYLWQSAYTELYFTDIYWPDFGEDDFVQAMKSYQQRGRRFGKK